MRHLALAIAAALLGVACQSTPPPRPDPPQPPPPPPAPSEPAVVLGLEARGLLAGLLVADLDDDGAEEVVMAFDPPEQEEGPGLIACVNLPGGDVRWQTRVPSPLFDGLGLSPHLIAIPGGVAVVAQDRGALIALGAADGAQRWRWDAGPDERLGREGFRVAAGPGLLLLDLPFTPGGRTFMALDLANGAERWRVSAPDAFGPLLLWPRFADTHAAVYAGERTLLLRLKDGRAPDPGVTGVGAGAWIPSGFLAWSRPEDPGEGPPSLQRFNPGDGAWGAPPRPLALGADQGLLTDTLYLTADHVIIACGPDAQDHYYPVAPSLCGVPRHPEAQPWTLTLPDGWGVSSLGAEEFGPASHSDNLLPRYVLARLEQPPASLNAPQRWAALDLVAGELVWSSETLSSGAGTTPHGALITWRSPHYVLAAPASGGRGALWRVWMTLHAETGAMTPPREIEPPAALRDKPPYSGPLFATLGAHYIAGGVASEVWVVHLDSGRLAAMTSPGFKARPAPIAEELGPVWRGARP